MFVMKINHLFLAALLVICAMLVAMVPSFAGTEGINYLRTDNGLLDFGCLVAYTVKVKLNKPQREALKKYNFALAQEDRYLGSVFVTPSGQRAQEAKTQIAYQACIKLGMTHEHGL